MNANTLKRVHQFGRVGKIILTGLLAVDILAAVAMGIINYDLAQIPANFLTATVRTQVTCQGHSSYIGTMWRELGGTMVFPPDGDAAAQLGEDGTSTLSEPGMELFGMTFSSAMVYQQGDEQVLEATTAPKVYSVGFVQLAMLSVMLTAVAMAVAAGMLRQMFQVIAGCETIFCDELVRKMKAAGWSLLPVAVLASVSETLCRELMGLNVGLNGIGAQIRWEWLIAFAVTMCLTVVFHYGVQLQRESDETL